MDGKGLLTNNFQNFDNIDRGMYTSGINPFAGYQFTNKFATPYQFPAVSDSNIFSLGGGGTFDQAFPQQQLHDSTHGFGLKFGAGGGGGGGGGTGYGHSGGGQTQTQTHYGPPMIMSGGGKGGKLKGAALSALTLLAFLFFLNLLQTCLKDQMDTMSPTVMVMSAGQRAVIARNEENTAKKRFDQNYESNHSDEFAGEYDDGDYDVNMDDVTAGMTKYHKRIRTKLNNYEKRHKSKTLSSTIGPKLQNLQLIRSTM